MQWLGFQATMRNLRHYWVPLPGLIRSLPSESALLAYIKLLGLACLWHYGLVAHHWKCLVVFQVSSSFLEHMDVSLH